MKMIYYANMSANNNNVANGKPFEYSSKKKAISSIKKICKGYHFQSVGNISKVIVFHEEAGVPCYDYEGYIVGCNKNFTTALF